MEISLVNHSPNSSKENIEVQLSHSAPEIIFSYNHLAYFEVNDSYILNLRWDGRPRQFSASVNINEIYVRFCYTGGLYNRVYALSFMYWTKNEKDETILATSTLKDFKVDDVTTQTMNKNQLRSFLYDTIDTPGKFIFDDNGVQYVKFIDGRANTRYDSFIDLSTNGLVNKYNSSLQYYSISKIPESMKAKTLYDFFDKSFILTEHGDDPLVPIYPYLITFEHDTVKVQQIKITMIGRKSFEVESRTTRISKNKILELIKNSQ